MADDAFGKTTRSLIKNVAIGASGVLGAAAAGPGGAVVAGAFTTSVADWFSSIRNRSDEALNEARLSAVEDECQRLDDRMRKFEAERAAQGVPEEPPDVLRQHAVSSEFAQAVSTARTREKREALVNAAAHQFDPRLGAPAAREYWFGVIRSLPDVQIWALRTCNEQKSVAFQNGKAFCTQSEPASPIALTDEEAGALADGLEKLEAMGLVQAGHGSVLFAAESGVNTNLQIFEVNSRGRSVLKFILD
jgi:hypothetical protein